MIRIGLLLWSLLAAGFVWAGQLEVFSLGDLHEYEADPLCRHTLRDQLAVLAAVSPEHRLLLLAGDTLTHLYSTGKKALTNIPSGLTDPRTGKCYTYSDADLKVVRDYDMQYLALLGTVHPDVAVLGNHDSDRGVPWFAELCRRNGIRLVADDCSEALPWVMVDKVDSDGRHRKIGIVGLRGVVHIYPKKVDRPLPNSAVLIRAAREARAHGAEAVILLSHQPDADDTCLRNDPAVTAVFDLIVGAHSHNIFPASGQTAVTVFPPGGRPRQLVVLKAGAHGGNLGRATLDFGPDHCLRRVTVWNR